MNSEKFKQVYYPYREKLYRIAFRLLMDVQAAEDAVQETYLKLWDKRHELHGVDSPEAFAVTVLRNMCINHLRWKKDKTMVPYDYVAVEKASLQDDIENRDEAAILMEMIGNLPGQQRQVLTLRHCEGYSYEEIEEATGLEAGHIRVIVSRTRKILREQFEKNKRREGYGYG